jgi:YggT family protein
MALIMTLAKFYIAVLLVRLILTQQELVYNPIGKVVATLTNPLANMFSRSGVQQLKSASDRLIPLFILAVALIAGLINGLFGASLVLGVVEGVSDIVHFVAMFFIVCLLVGSLSVPTNGGVPIFFLRIGSVWVKVVRKVVNIRSNKVVIPAIILVLLVSIIIDTLIHLPLLAALDSTGTLFEPMMLLSFIWQVVLSFGFSFADLLGAFMLVLIVRALMSWVSPDPRNALVQLVYHITEPVVAPVRRILPPIGMLDLSVLVVMLGLVVLRGLVYKFLAFLSTSMFV